nr:hypothetical protein [Tanacetum cinerariifolium]
MASAVICLSKGQRFNFSRYIFDSLVRNIDNSSKFYMYPHFIQLIIQAQVVDLSSHTTRFISPALTQKVFANMRRVGKGFSGVETPLFENILAVRDVDAEEEVQVSAQDEDIQESAAEQVADDVVQPTPTSPSPSSPVIPSTPPHQSPCPPQLQDAEGSSHLFQQVLDTCSALVRRSEGLEHDKVAQQLEIVKLKAKVLSMQEDDTEVQEVVEVVTTTKLITEVVTAAATQVVAASTPITAAKPKVLKIAAAAPAVSTRKRKGVIIRDPEEELHTETLAETLTVKDKGKGILIEDPKLMKKKDQVKMDANDSPLLGVNTPRINEDRLKLMELMVFLMTKGVCDEFGLNAARLSKFLLSGKLIMTSLFAESHNMVAILEKSDAAEGFEQIIDFLSGSCINHALTMNPHVYISCIKQFWNIAVVKRSGDVTILQALVDKKRIVITEEVIRKILQLNDAEGVICLPNEEIFAGLARMVYEKPSTKLTFYKAFFSTQWKFFIHTILHSLSAKRTSWNEFSSAMASALICFSSRQRFNFSKYIFESLTNIADLSKHTTRCISPVLTQKVFANMRRVGKGFSGVETPLFESMLAVRDVAEDAEAQVPAQGDDVQEPTVAKVATDVVPPTPTSPSPSSLVIPSSPPHQSPCSPQPQDAEGSSLLFQRVLDTCSALVLRVEGLENAKAAQQLEIVKLKARVKKLEKINKVKSSKLRWLKKVGTSQHDVENVFNQGRMSVDIDQDERIELLLFEVISQGRLRFLVFLSSYFIALRGDTQHLSMGDFGNGYSRKRQKQGKKRQNQTQSGKDRKRQSHSKPKVKIQNPRSTKVNLGKVKVNPENVKVNPDKAKAEK